MWPLEVIKKMNSPHRIDSLCRRVSEELNGFDYEKHSFKILSSAIKHNGKVYNYIAPNTSLGKVVINEMLYNPKEAFFIDELNVYLF